MSANDEIMTSVKDEIATSANGEITMSASGEITTLVNEENAQNRRLTDADVPEPLNVAAAGYADTAVGVTTYINKINRNLNKRSGSGRILSKKIGDVTTAQKKTLRRRHTKKKDGKGQILAKKTHDDAATALKKIHRSLPRKKRGRDRIPPKLLGGSLQLTNVQSHQK